MTCGLACIVAAYDAGSGIRRTGRGCLPIEIVNPNAPVSEEAIDLLAQLLPDIVDEQA